MEIGDITHPQRGYWFAAIVPAAMKGFLDYGENYTKDETHQRLKEFCPVFQKQKQTATGRLITVGYRSFSDDDFTKNDMKKAIDEAIRFIGETFGIPIDHPDEH